MRLPIFQSDSQPLTLLQTQWASKIEPTLSLPQVQGVFVDAVLPAGTLTINHKLGRKPQGWQIMDIDSASVIYRSQPFNLLTLTLTSSASANVKIWVY